jgi:hypothetical protein
MATEDHDAEEESYPETEDVVEIQCLRLGHAWFERTGRKILGQTPCLEIGRSHHFIYMTVAIPVKIEDVPGKIGDGEWEWLLLLETDSIGHRKIAFVFEPIDEHPRKRAGSDRPGSSRLHVSIGWNLNVIGLHKGNWEKQAGKNETNTRYLCFGHGLVIDYGVDARGLTTTTPDILRGTLSSSNRFVAVKMEYRYLPGRSNCS